MFFNMEMHRMLKSVTSSLLSQAHLALYCDFLSEKSSY